MPAAIGHRVAIGSCTNERCLYNDAQIWFTACTDPSPLLIPGISTNLFILFAYVSFISSLPISSSRHRAAFATTLHLAPGISLTRF